MGFEPTKTATSNWSSANRRFRAWLPRHDDNRKLFMPPKPYEFYCDILVVFSQFWLPQGSPHTLKCGSLLLNAYFGSSKVLLRCWMPCKIGEPPRRGRDLNTREHGTFRRFSAFRHNLAWPPRHRKFFMPCFAYVIRTRKFRRFLVF